MLKYLLQANALAAFAFLAACGSDPDAEQSAGAGRRETPPQLVSIDLPDNRWTWVPVAGAECRDSSPAGVAIRPRNHSGELLIFLGGGPICVDAQTCATSGAPLGFWAKNPPRSGVFADRPENPFADWNQVWVPHCTDDYHIGAARDVTVAGLNGVQQFVGHTNMALFLDQIKTEFDGVTRVVLGGESSGGQGAIANLPQVRRAFGSEIKMILFIDSGPPVPSSESQGILDAMIGLWGANRTMMSECGEACGDPTNFFVDHFSWLVDTYEGEIDIALSAYLMDNVEIGEFGISGDTWAAHLESIRSEILDGTGSSTFYVDSRGHIVTNSMYAAKVGTLTLADWLGLVLGDEPQHVGP